MLQEGGVIQFRNVVEVSKPGGRRCCSLHALLASLLACLLSLLPCLLASKRRHGRKTREERSMKRMLHAEK